MMDFLIQATLNKLINIKCMQIYNLTRFSTWINSILNSFYKILVHITSKNHRKLLFKTNAGKRLTGHEIMFSLLCLYENS